MWHNITRLVSGSILSQLILIVSTPIITRLFAPEAMGIAVLFSATYALLIPFVTLKYDQAVILPKDVNSAKAIGAVAMVLSTVICTFVAIGVVFWLHFYRDWKDIWVLLLPFALWFGAALTMMQQWSSRFSNYSHYARALVLGSVVNVSICICAALLFSPRPDFLVLGFTASIAIGFTYTVYGFKLWPFRMKSLTIRSIRRRLLLYRSFPSLVLPTVLVGIVGVNSVPVVLAMQYSIDEVGFFAVTNRVLLIPAAVVGGALAEAVRSEFALRQRTKNSVLPVFWKAVTLNTTAAVGFFGIIYLFAPSAFEFVFGPQYIRSGILVQPLILATFSQFIITPFMYVFTILRKPALGLTAQIFVWLFPVGGLTIMTLLAVPLNSTLFFYSIGTLAGAAIMIVLVYNACRTFDASSY